MLFTSLEFLLAFFPITLGVYFILPKQARNYWLLCASLFFYAWGEPTFLLALLASILFNYLIALPIARMEPGRLGRKLLLALAVFVNIGFLLALKYFNFFRRIIPGAASLFGGVQFVMPIGISFFTFQALSYVIDVYRGISPQRNPAHLGLYISFFPQLIAGPIVRYTTIADQIESRTITPDSFACGMLRFLRGFAKKMLLANTLAVVADQAFESQSISVAMAWLGIVCYTLQIYFDFSGYSEMAIGLGQIFGFTFLENFNYPYISKTITEFWRRWHISLGSWFRDYLYIPLGGSRVKSRTRLVFNLLVVWTLTGMWHGASWNFIFWGLMHGVLLVFEKLTNLPQRIKGHRVGSALYQAFTLFAVMMGLVLFRADSLNAAARYLLSLFGLRGAPLADGVFRLYLHDYRVFLIAGILCATPLFKKFREKISALSPRADRASETAACLAQIALFLLGISYLVIEAHNPFIYFNF